MRTRYGQSPWIENFPRSRRPDHPRLRGEISTDVVIVGGGMTGCATAYACAVAGLKPVVVEAARLGQSNAGRGAGLLLPEPGPPFKDVQQMHGLRAARRLFEQWRRASLDAAALIRRLGIPCGLEPCDLVTVADREDGKGLRREYEARSAAGLDVRWLSANLVRRATALEAPAAMRSNGAFSLDPHRACLGLAAAAKARGATFFERTRVTKLRAGAKQVEIALEGGTARARTVVVCTGMATAEFKPLRRHFKPRELYLVMTEPVPAVIRRQLASRGLTIADTVATRRQVRWTRDDRLVIAGAAQDPTPLRKRAQVLIQRTGQLMYELLIMNPAISGLRPQYGWECAYGETADDLMYVGAHRNYPRHLFALGGDSLSGSFFAARVLARAAMGTPAKGDELLGWTR